MEDHVHLKIDYVRFRLDDLSSPLLSESKINLSTFDGAEYRLVDLTRFLESVKERDRLAEANIYEQRDCFCFAEILGLGTCKIKRQEKAQRQKKLFHLF